MHELLQACFAELAVTLAARGLRVSEFLDELYNRYVSKYAVLGSE